MPAPGIPGIGGRCICRPAGTLAAGLCLGVLLVLSTATQAGERSAPLGRWSTGGTLIEVRSSGDSLSARIIALKHPLYREKDRAGVVGMPRLDHQNPDRALRDRGLLGLELFSGFEFRRGRWEGRLYVPSSGRTFSARLWMKDETLKVRGFILGMPWLGRVQEFVPISACDENIVKMIARAGLSDTPCLD